MPHRPIGSFALFIRNYLLKKGVAYVREMWKAYNRYLKRRFYKPVKYTSFVRYIKLLKDLELIEEVSMPPEKTKPKVWGGKITIRRKYYRINRSKIEDPAWLNPFEHAKKKKEIR